MPDLSYQLYSSREFPPLPDTLRMLATLGYTQVEAYGGLFDDIGQLGRELERAGLTMPSAHLGLEMLENETGRVLEIAECLGIRALFCPFVPPQSRPTDEAGWRALGARLQAAGAPYRDAGLAFGWHNHDFEFAPLSDGSAPMRHLLAGGPALDWEADIAWIVRGGADPFAWLRDYGDRIFAVHVKDIAPPGENEEEDGWADVGHGVLDWPALWQALAATRADIRVVEHDNPTDDRRFARRSIETISRFGSVK